MTVAPDNNNKVADPHWLRMRDCADRTGWHRHLSHREHERLLLVRDWFGPLAVAEIVDRQPPAQAAAELVDQALARLKPVFSPVLTQLQEQWGALVGHDIAKQSRPSGFSDGRLLVEVPQSTWLYVLETMHKPVILQKVRAVTAGAVTEIRFVAGERLTPRRGAAARPGAKPAS